MVHLVQAPAASIWCRSPRQSGEGWEELAIALRTRATSNQMSSCRCTLQQALVSAKKYLLNFFNPNIGFHVQLCTIKKWPTKNIKGKTWR